MTNTELELRKFVSLCVFFKKYEIVAHYFFWNHKQEEVEMILEMIWVSLLS